MPDGEPLSLKDFIPVVGVNYIAPHKIKILTGTRYQRLKYDRPVLLIPQTPTTVGTTYIYPGGTPADDTSSIPIAAGNNVYLDARGEWWLRVTSSADETFLVIDIGAAANAAAIAASVGSPSTVTPYAAITMAAPGVNSDIDNASEEVVAAAAARRYLYVENTSTGGQILWLAFGATAVVGSGIRLSPGQHFELISPTGITTQAVNAISDLANGSASYQTGT